MGEYENEMSMMAGAVQLHEYFTSLLNAGFREDQAMRILLTTISTQFPGGNE